MGEKRKTSATLDTEALDGAREYGINVSAVVNEARRRAVKEARNRAWVEENVDAFAAQAEWHEKNAHRYVRLMEGPGAKTWRD